MEANNPQSKMPPLNLISAGWKGIRFVSPEAKQAYFRYVHAISVRKQQEGGELIAEVKALGEAIDSDPAIRMCLQNGLDILAKGNDPKVPLTNNSIADTLRDINTVATTPPVFQNRLFVGMPFSILFVGLFNNPFGQRFLGSPVVNYHLNKIFNVYALLLQSPASQAVLNQENGWLCPEARKFVDYKDFVHDQTDPFYGFSSWNSWFTRSFAQGARPIDPNPLRITNSSDHYCVDVPKQPVCHAQKSSSFWLKDDNYSLYDMFCVNKMGQEIKKIVDESFVDGTVYQGYLSPWCYHHWHAPVAGTIQKSYKITGSYVHEITCCYAEKSVSEQALLTSLSTRHIFIINTHHPAIGRVAVVQVGMGQVMSCNSFVEEGAIVEKGQEIGRFEFGGSTHAIVFDRRATLKFNPQIYQMQDSHPKLQKVGVWLAEASLPS